ncbi:GTPase-associated system all-helical protein GASH [Seonamhaeicola marinus]|uniref:GTPase-associated system helical domain-containing protein n=1 Tax=Seonamhaeicola marinus TaxID=1912246 RepID=A0A5D0HUE0_9FLAO|nr:GTPase-associated system all-helical protein GASH [Seonamhaeicola marinus]TYA74935.1 hypothetical protein FUA24_16680 [Seonamhaeicola marinus]
MSETILQTYLNNQFIKTSDSGNIASLKKAITEVVKRLEKKKQRIIPFTLVAIDPLISEEDPIVIEVEKIIIGKWSAFKNSVTATNDKSITYIRAVILQALSQIAKKDENSAAIIWLSARNAIKFYKLSNQENNVLSEFLLDFGNNLEISAQKAWSSNIDVKLPEFSVPEIEIKTTTISKKYITERLKAAAGHSTLDENESAIKYENANRYWANSNQNWTHDFGKIAGEALTLAINKALSTQNQAIKDSSGFVNKNMESLVPYIESIGNEISSGIDASNLRSKLLWWKESLFSNSLKVSYREIDPITSAVTMAIDLAEMVSPIYPLSLDYFLKETLKGLYPDEVDKEVDLSKFVEGSKKISNDCAELLTTKKSDIDERKLLFVALANNLSNDSYDVYSETGLSKDNKVTLGDLSVWLLHDLQAIKIANEK